MDKLLLIGGGGHCKSVLDTLLEINSFELVGIIDVKDKVGEKIHGIPYIGTDENIDIFYKKGISNAFITLGSIGDTKIRRKIYNLIKEIGFKVPNIIDNSAIVSRFTKLGEGIFVGKKVIINAGTTIENNCIINSGVIVEHDCTIGEFVHLAPGAALSGGVTIGRDTHIGTNSTIIEYRTIGSNVMIGAGSVIVSNISSNKKVYGNPGEEH